MYPIGIGKQVIWGYTGPPTSTTGPHIAVIIIIIINNDLSFCKLPKQSNIGVKVTVIK